jgi:transcriptional regulator with AAA-type ATPase domain
MKDIPILRVYRKDEFRWTFTLLEKETSIGRDPHNQIVLPLSDVSRLHAILHREDNTFYLEDKSDKGIEVNHQTLPGATLHHRDEIQIGVFRLIFELMASEEPAPSTLTLEPTLLSPPMSEQGDLSQSRLHVVSGPDTGKELVLKAGTLRIGRNPKNHLVLSEPLVSAFHAEVERYSEGLQVRDLGSTNGTFINGQKIQSSIIPVNSEILIGKNRLRFLLEKRIHPRTSLGFGRLIGQSPKMNEVYQMIRKAGHSDATVLLQGETGCGKGLVANEIHRSSSRAKGPFITVDCSAIPRDLILSELFGHEKGAFTNAISQRKGAFELAHRGTIFLDEIGELPLALQSNLLKVLEERTFKRVGGNETLSSDFRIVAATHRWLNQDMLQKRFRQDLYFRLCVFPILLPPLRERKEDIPLLVQHFLAGKSVHIPNETMEHLMAYDWPGNIRELHNAIERAMILLEGNVLHPGDILFPSQGVYQKEQGSDLPSTPSLEEVEKQVIQRTLKAHQGDKKATAQALGISLSTLYEKLKPLKTSPS